MQKKKKKGKGKKDVQKTYQSRFQVTGLTDLDYVLYDIELARQCVWVLTSNVVKEQRN